MAIKTVRLDNIIPKFVGKENITVYAKGTLGQALFIAGADKWTGGLGVVQADEIFGGLDIGGSWSIWAGSYGVISSRYLRIWGGTSCHHSTVANATSTDPISVEFEAMIDTNIGTANVGWVGFRQSTSSKCVVWYFVTAADVLYCKPYHYDTGGAYGTAIAINPDQIYRFKIVVHADSNADFYLNGKLMQTIAVSNGNVDFKADVWAAAGYTVFTKRVRMKYGS